MPKKLTLETVKKEFEGKGYTLLSTVCRDSRQSFRYICPNGYEGSMRLDHLRRGVRCPTCSGNKKLTLEFVRASFEKKGYTLVSKEYISGTKLDYICPKGHTGSVTWGNWREGNECFVCFGKKKPEFSVVKASFEAEGYTLLSKEYVNENTKLISVCPKGHLYKVTWSNWNHRDARCGTCYMERIMPTIEEVRDSFEAEGYELLSTKYINANVKLKCVCDEGHPYSVKWKDWKDDHRCKKCYSTSISGPRNYNWNGGKSFEPYSSDWTKQLKDFIKERDGNRCLNPDCWGRDKVLSIHHIDYNKKDCSSNNLITVCSSCNARANYDRNWHTSWYQAVLNKRYNYKYESR